MTVQTYTKYHTAVPNSTSGETLDEVMKKLDEEANSGSLSLVSVQDNVVQRQCGDAVITTIIRTVVRG